MQTVYALKKYKFNQNFSELIDISTALRVFVGNIKVPSFLFPSSILEINVGNCWMCVINMFIFIC